jgi:hypothetical protein
MPKDDGFADDPSVIDLFGEDDAPAPVPMVAPLIFATLDDAVEFVQAHLDDGVECPCCKGFVRRYKRKFNATMSRSLIWLVRAWETNGNNWVDVPKTAPRWLVRSNQLPTVRWWGMVERPPSGDSAQKHSGLWRPTQKGVDFAHGLIKVPERAVTFHGVVEDLVGQDVSVKETLGTKFDYGELMSA